MDLQLTGNSSELLFIETNDFCFIIKGNKERTGIAESKALNISGLLDADVQEYNPFMYFKEYSNYEVIFESKNGSSLEFYHESEVIRSKLTPMRRGSKSLSGVINFGGSIGKSDLVLFINGIKSVVVTIEVFPTKLSYKEDYEEILRDVNEEIYNLAFGFLSRTYIGAEISNKHNGSSTEFYSILNYIFDKLIKGIDVTIENPHHQLVKDGYICKYQSLKNSSRDTVKWLEKRAHVLVERDGRYIPREALQTKKRVTVDTKENRFLKFILLSINKKIDGFIRAYENVNYYSKVDNKVIEKLLCFKKKIQIRINNSYLSNINGEFNEGSLSLVFTMASGYREIYKYYLMLQRGLNISSNVFSLSIKELSVLYEYWCFIKINSLLKRKYNLLSSDLIKVDKSGISVTLKKGREACFTYENPLTKEIFKVYYNSERGTKTVGQKPDNILSMEKGNSEKCYEFIFDAKYKVDTDKDYIKRYGGIGPREEDINTMHRYRDAILYKKNKVVLNKNTVFGAFVLFPYNDEAEYKNHEFYKSINEVNIGGIPFLPSSTSLMEDFLNEVVGESSYSTFERGIENIGVKEYIQEDNFNNRNVLVGSLRNENQLDVNINNRFYHTAKRNVDLIKNKIEYVAIVQSKKNFPNDYGIRYYGKIVDIKEVKRSEITELPKKSDELYYRFEIEEWKLLDNTINIIGQGVRRVIYTSEFLLFNASTISELLIKEKDELRAWIEIKRLVKDVVIEDGADNSLKITEVFGKEVIFKDSEIRVIDKDTVRRFDKGSISDDIRGFLRFLQE